MADVNMIKAVIKMRGYTQRQFAEKIGISYPALNRKLNRKSEFKESEMIAIKEQLKSDEILLKLFL